MPKRRHYSETLTRENDRAKRCKYWQIRKQPHRKCKIRPKRNRKAPYPKRIISRPGGSRYIPRRYDESRNANAKVGPSQFGLLKVLGEGAFGKVFIARKLVGGDAGELYAIKIIPKVNVRMHEREGLKLERDVLADIQHPFIIKLHYAFQTPAKLYLVLDYARGGDFQLHLAKHIMLDENHVKFYTAEVATALHYLHSRTIIYRDLKPANILLNSDGHVVLTDFGLAKRSNNKTTDSVCGTRGYMAPEIINQQGYSYAADWWSFGVLMFQLITGRLPFYGAYKYHTMYQILKNLPTSMHISLDGRRILRALCQRRPAKRLGLGPNGMADLREHAFFATINFDALLKKKIKPPFKPDGRRDADFNSFPKIRENLLNEPATPGFNRYFRGYSFVAPRLLRNGSSDESDMTSQSEWSMSRS